MSIRSSLLLLLPVVGVCVATEACSSSTSAPIASGDAGSSGTSGSSGDVMHPPDAATTDGSSAGGTALTGKLGALGDVKPTVSSLWISNSGETLVYMSSAPLTCEQLKTSRWLGAATAGSQVIEIVIRGAPKVGDVAVPPGEVNFAQGGKSSSYEVNADSGNITFTKAEATGVVEGTLSASYAGGDTVSGSFHADFCAGGQGY
ncbi:MAG: hypothetical protein JWP87_4541 [Labilithrix sp.]|nr:hypothetical protein [Labilithrix sp.]